ncbi:MAG TPA: GNAT family N-acetyltransferase [Ilumatobacteraceae bacterium]|nr:GNAT family N-acetyltransferase [Ilumatobacteraceae bacterium]
MTTTAAPRPVRARFGRWPYDAEVAHLVLLDHHMVPDHDDIRRWIADARSSGARAIRTGALFPPSTPAFVDAGFVAIDSLRLLELDLDTIERYRSTALAPASTVPEPAKFVRLRPSHLGDAAAVDRASFAAPWANDASALADILAATPHTRARGVRADGRLVAFIISGRAGDWGYVQRLAVDPSARRSGLATILLRDATAWMRRRRVRRVLVNTAVDNHPATELYRTFGFVERAERLTILERSLSAPRIDAMSPVR